MTSTRYLIQARRILKLVDAWPEDAVAGRKRRPRHFARFLSVQTSLLIFGEGYFIVSLFHELTFFALGDVSVALALTFLVLLRNVLPNTQKYGDVFRDWIMKFHLQHFKHRNEYTQKICTAVDMVSHYFTMGTIALTITAAAFYNFTPFYRNVQFGAFRADQPENVTMEFSVHYAFPGFRQEAHFKVTSVLNIYLSYVCAFSICFVDGCLCLMVFQIIGHIKILVHDMRSFPKPQFSDPQKYRRRDGTGTSITVQIVKDFDEEENKEIAKLLKDCVLYHIFIMSFTDSISSFFGPMLAINYSYQFFSLSLLFVECMQGTDEILRYGSLTAVTLAQLIQLSVIFEIVGSESDKLKDEIYCVPWESMNVSNQRTVLMMLRRMQTPIQVTAMGMTAVGVRTMASILRTSLSYCAFLNSIPNNS